MIWEYKNHQYQAFFTNKDLDEIKAGTVYTVKTKNDLIVIRRKIK